MIKKSPLVSIIIPVYNVENYIINCCDSLLNQTYNNIEYIFIDDRGTDKSIEILENYRRSHVLFRERSKVITHTENGGLSKARNTGLKNAIGDYVFFMDSDDTLPKDAIHHLVDNVLKIDSDVVIGNIKLIGTKSTHIPHVKAAILVNDQIIKNFSNNIYPVTAPAKLYHKSFLLSNNIKFKEGLLYEDVIFQFEIALKANKISIIDDYVYNYIIRANSITSSKLTDSNINSRISVCEYIFNRPERNTHLKKYIDTFLSRQIFISKLMILNSNISFDAKRDRYKRLRRLDITNGSFLFMITKKFPFSLFYALFKIPFYIYKNVK